MDWEKLVIATIALGIVCLGVYQTYIFVGLVVLITFWFSLSLEYQRRIYETDFFAKGVPFFQGHVFVATISFGQALIRTIASGLAALFLFPIIAQTLCPKRTLNPSSWLKPCEINFEHGTTTEEGVFITLLFASLLFLMAVVAFILRRIVGRANERWVYFRLALPFGFLYSMGYVIGSRVGIIEPPSEKLENLLGDLIKLKGTKINFDSALFVLSELDKLTSVIWLKLMDTVSSQLTYPAPIRSIFLILEEVVFFALEFMISANVFIGFVLAAITVMLARLDTKSLAKYNGNLTLVERAKLFLTPADNLLFKVDVRKNNN